MPFPKRKTNQVVEDDLNEPAEPAVKRGRKPKAPVVEEPDHEEVGDLGAMPEETSGKKFGASKVHPFLKTLYAVYFNSAGEYKRLGEQIRDTILNSPNTDIQDHLLDAHGRDVILKAAEGKNIELRPLGEALTDLVDDLNPFLHRAAKPILVAFAVYFKTGRDRAFDVIQKSSGDVIFPTWIRSNFLARSRGKTADLRTQLAEIVEEVTGRTDDHVLTRFESADLQRSNKELRKKYDVLRKSYSASWKSEAENFIRKSGFPTMPAEKVVAYLEENDLEHGLVPGFKGHYDCNLQMFSPDGDRAARDVYANSYSRVEMNETYPEPKVYFKAYGYRDGAPPLYVFLRGDSSVAARRKFEKTREFINLIDHARDLWLSSIRKWDPEDPHALAGIILELAYQFAARTGTHTKETYGITTARVKHIAFKGNAFILKYPGKYGVVHANKLIAKTPEERIIVKALKHMVEGKGPEDHIFTYEDSRGKPVPVKATFVNNVIDKVTTEVGLSRRTTVKDFRTLIGTRLFMERSSEDLKGVKEINEKELMHRLVSYGEDVGAVLNHVKASGDSEGQVTGKIALSSYIDPHAQAALFEQYGLALPSHILNLFNKHRLEHMEASVRLLAAAEDEPIELLESTDEEDPPKETPPDDEEPAELPQEDPPKKPAAKQPEEKKEDPPKKEEPKKEESLPLMTVDRDAELLGEILAYPTLAEDR